MAILNAGWTISVLGLLVILAYFNAPMLAWFVYGALILGLIKLPLWLWGVFGLIAMTFNVPFIRQVLITLPIMRIVKGTHLWSTLSATDRAIVETGTVWVDGELFSGKPDFNSILSEPYTSLSAKEQTFVDGPVAQVCQMATDWEIYQRRDLPQDVWAYLRQERFFGITIPTEYGGLGLSYTAYSAVLTKLTSRSYVYASAVGVGNFGGPAQMLMHYGTSQQKQEYLPKLASGAEVACLAVTAPMTGADANSLHANGILFKGTEGELYLRLNWQKQHVSLGAIATLIGLVIQLRDPDQLLGTDLELGPTCVLIPMHTSGVQRNQRHDLMGMPCYSAPIAGRNVVVPASQIIGGIEQVGRGWTVLLHSRMLDHSLNAPASCTAIAKVASRVASASSVIQEQLALSTDPSQLTEDSLARIAGLTYLMEAARLYTCSAVEQDGQSVLLSAIAKHQLTKLARYIISDGMTILGSLGICRGPRNVLANLYTAIPTAAIDTDTYCSEIYSRSVSRYHDHITNLIAALEDNNIAAFDYALWQHIGLIGHNLMRAQLLSWTRGYIVKSPVPGKTKRYYQKLSWASAMFATLSDLAFMSYGIRLKHQERITSRLADMLSWLYLATATLRRFEAEGRRQEDLAILHWAMTYSLNQLQKTLDGLVANLEMPVLPQLLQRMLLSWIRLNSLSHISTDIQNQAVTRQLQSPDGRQHMTQGLYVPTNSNEALGVLERAYQLSMVAGPIVKKIKTALHNGQLKVIPPVGRVEAALRAGLLTGAESDLAITAERAQLEAIHLDTFTLTEYQHIGRQDVEQEITETE